MRIQTLIVKGIITGACLLVPTEVFADDHGKPEDLPQPPVTTEGEKGTDTSDEANDNANNDQETGKPAEKPKPVLPPEAKASVKVDHSEENGKPDYAKVNVKNESVDGKDVSEAKKDTNKPSNESGKRGKAVHSDRNENPVKDTKSSLEKNKKSSEKDPTNQELDRKTTTNTNKHKQNKDSIHVKETEKGKSNHNQQPLPHDKSPANSPIVMPTQTVNSLSKSTNHDGQPNTFGNGFNLYGLSFMGTGPLITLDREFLSEHRREHNQWINAPPSPPPKSNLLPHTV